MINVPGLSAPEGDRGRTQRWDVFRGMKNVWSTVLNLVSGRAAAGEVSPKEALHPDFCIRNDLGDVVWYQNTQWGPERKPPFKVGFYFNDPAVLNNCPWVCKFALNANKAMPEFAYFAVAYGVPSGAKYDFGLEKMLQWVMNFDHPSLMKYDGTLVKMLKQ